MTSSSLTLFLVLTAGGILWSQRHRWPPNAATLLAIPGFAASSTARVTPAHLVMAVHTPGSDLSPPLKPRRRIITPRDPLADHRAITGLRVRVRWWERIRAILGLVVMVVALGVILAALFGMLFFGVRLSVELIVS